MEDAITTQGKDLIVDIISIINELCNNLFSSINKEVFNLLDKLVFIDKSILSTGENTNKLLSGSQGSGVLILANCLFTAFVLYYCIRLIISQLTRI